MLEDTLKLILSLPGRKPVRSLPHQLDGLFAELARAPGAPEASRIETLIWSAWMSHADAAAEESLERATRAIAMSFLALAAYVGIESLRDLLSRSEPEASLPGIVLAALSLVVMPVLARAKRKVAPVLGSRAAVSEANQTSLCAWLSAVLLVGLAANAALGWWWADPAAGLGIAALAAIEGVRTWRAESLADTCCD